MLGLGRVAVQRSWFPVMRSPDGARQGSGQSLARLRRTADGELDLLVDLAGQAPGLILWPYQVRCRFAARQRAVPSQSWASLSASTGPVNSSIARLGIATRGARGAGCMLTQPSQMAAYATAGVAVQEPRVASAA